MRNHDDKNIISYDTQGWPVCKMSLRDMLDAFATHIDGKYVIDDDDPSLDIFPRVLEDDGTGYGVNEKCVTEFYVHSKKERENDTDDKFINVFVEAPLPNIELWKKAKFLKNENVTVKGETVNENASSYIKDIKECKDGHLKYLVRYIVYNENDSVKESSCKWYKEEELEY